MSQPNVQAHHVFITAIAELIGVSLLAIAADSNEKLGKIAVAIMIGWFLLFLISNSFVISYLSGFVGGNPGNSGIKSGPRPHHQ